VAATVAATITLKEFPQVDLKHLPSFIVSDYSIQLHPSL
jgi:hypothetical protein